MMCIDLLFSSAVRCILLDQYLFPDASDGFLFLFLFLFLFFYNGVDHEGYSERIILWQGKEIVVS